MSKAVFLSWAYTPMRVPRAVQVARLANFLDRPIEVICGVDTADTMATKDNAPENDRIRLTRLCRPGWRRYADALLARSIPFALKTPDPYWDWARGAARYVLRSIKFAPGDVFVSFGQPMSDHLAGLKIKRARGVPWIAHFSDPWSDNALLKRGPVSARLNRWMEHSVIANADCVIMTSEEAADLMMAKYPSGLRTKVRVIPHAFDKTAYPTRTRPEQDKVVIFRHLGNFYQQRSPQALLNGIRILAQHHPDALANVSFELVGAFEKDLEKKLDWSGLPPGLVEIKPPVGYCDSLRLMVEADVLLVIDAPAELSVFLPSKLVEYIGSGRPVFGITPAGTAARLISSLGGAVADPIDPEGVANGLLTSIAQARTVERGTIWGAPNIRELYEAPVVAAQFDDAINETVRTT